MRRCCCCKVRTACLVLAVLGLLDCLLRFVASAASVARTAARTEHARQQEVAALLRLHTEVLGAADMDEAAAARSLALTEAMSCADLAVSTVATLTCAALLYGVIKEKERFLTPSLVLIPVDVLLTSVFLAALSATLGLLHPLVLVFSVAHLASAVLLGLVWLVVFSHRQQIRDQLTHNEEEEWAEDGDKFSMAMA